MIEPAVKAFYLADVDGGTVFAIEAGLVEIRWRRSNDSLTDPVPYLIDRRPAWTPMAVYHTHNPEADFKANPLPLPETRAPIVNFSDAPQVSLEWHWNIELPPNAVNPYLIQATSGQARQLLAKEKTGIILLELRQAGQFFGIEIVELRSPLVPNPPSRVDLGFQLLPYVAAPQPEPPLVVRGLGSGTPESQFVYQHNKTASPQYSQSYAIRKTSNPEDIEVYWMTRGIKNVVWPYERHQYTTAWPVAASKYQRPDPLIHTLRVQAISTK